MLTRPKPRNETRLVRIFLRAVLVFGIVLVLLELATLIRFYKARKSEKPASIITQKVAPKHFNRSDERSMIPIKKEPKIMEVKQPVTQSGSDGLGHQLLGMYSCMLLPLVDKRFEYVKKNTSISIFTGHAGSKYSAFLLDTLQVGSKELSDDARILKLDNCMGRLKTCSSSSHCSDAKVLLSQSWRGRFQNFMLSAHLPSMRADDIILHARGGDRPNLTLAGVEQLPYIIKVITDSTSLRNLTIFCEYANDMKILKSVLIPGIRTLVADIDINFEIGGDPVISWTRMVRARVLILGNSSFSVSAALIRDEPTFSVYEQPIGGRYDVNNFPCLLQLSPTFINTINNDAIYYTPWHGATVKDCNFSLFKI